VTQTTPSLRRPDALLDLDSRSGTIKLAAVFLGTIALTLSSYITVPMYPVPMTMQSFAILMVAALYGWRLGTLTVLTWLGEAAIGLPVLAGGAGGIAVFAGPTAGYILSWPLITAVVGWLVGRGWNGHHPVLACIAMMLASTICLAMGAIWLAGFIGVEKAIAAGVIPFILGDASKSLLAVMVLILIARKGRI